MKRRMLCLVCGLCIMILAFPSIVSAEMKVTMVRTLESGGTLRRRPTSDSEKICSVHQYKTLDVYEAQSGWFRVKYRNEYGWISNKLVEIVAWENVAGSAASQSIYSNDAYSPSVVTNRYDNYDDSYEEYDMGVPNIGRKVYDKDDMNMVIFWVQTQLKATNIWYQGEQWDVTGKLGDHTMDEINAFMSNFGYRGHSGRVDQQVIDTLASYLGRRVVPVYVGGFYEAMDTIMAGGSTGSMYTIYSNLRDMKPHYSNEARWVQTVLKYLYYYDSTIDGKYGEATEKAVMDFQKDHHFQERDYVTLGVARRMLEEFVGRGYSTGLLP